jgi:hypothetical protein
MCKQNTIANFTRAGSTRLLGIKFKLHPSCSSSSSSKRSNSRAQSIVEARPQTVSHIFCARGNAEEPTNIPPNGFVKEAIGTKLVGN